MGKNNPKIGEIESIDEKINWKRKTNGNLKKEKRKKNRKRKKIRKAATKKKRK